MISVDVLWLALINVPPPSKRGRFLPLPSRRCNRSLVPGTGSGLPSGRRAQRPVAGLPRDFQRTLSLRFHRSSLVAPSPARNRLPPKPRTVLRDAALHSPRVPRFRNGGLEARAGRRRDKRG